MATLRHSRANASQLSFDGVDIDVDKAEFEVMGLRLLNEATVLVSREDRFDADGLVNRDRRIKPCLNALDGGEVGIQQRKLFCRL